MCLALRNVKANEGLNAVHEELQLLRTSVRTRQVRQLWGLRRPLRDACVPQRRYLTGYVVVPSETGPVREAYGHLLAFAHDSGIALDASRVLHRLLRCRDVDGVPMRYDLAYIPAVD